MTTTNTDSRPLVLYHAHCTDGYGAAFAAWCKLGTVAEYVSVKYGDPAPDVTGREVYVLDFSYPKDVTQKLIDTSKRFVWLDHHKSAFEAWCDDGEHELCEQSNGKDYVLLNNSKSGAMLAWEFFHPEKDAPRLIQRIDDRDRWMFKHDDSRALHAGLAMRKPWRFTDWLSLVPMGGVDWHRGYNECVATGRATLQVYGEQIKGAAERATKCGIVLPSEAAFDAFGLRPMGLVVNSPTLQSEIGHELANNSGTYGLVWYYDGATGRANCSLRSNGDYDVSAIAKRFGGGGHKNAAGFNIDMGTLLGWVKP